jgi:type VI secretion system protein ImpM
MPEVALKPRRFGVYGKIPALGDFIRMDLPPVFVEPWDLWLQAGIRASREALGPLWNARYNSGPVWRFALDAGLCGPEGVLGILMPSVDRQGRQFPLTLAICLPESVCAATALVEAGATLERVTALALLALDRDLKPEALSEALENLPCPEPFFGPAVRRSASGTFLLIEAKDASQCLAGLLGLLAAGALGGKSLWYTEIDGVTRAFACSGLPPEERASLVFDAESPLWAAAS